MFFKPLDTIIIDEETNETNQCIGKFIDYTLNFKDCEILINNELHVCPISSIKKFASLPEETFKKEVQEKLPVLLKKINDALNHLLRPSLMLKFSPTTHYANNNCYLNEDTITTSDERVIVEPEIIQIKSMGLIREVTGWTVKEVIYNYGSFDEPDNYEQIKVGSYISVESAAANFIEIIFKQKSNDYWHQQSFAVEEEFNKNNPVQDLENK